MFFAKKVTSKGGFSVFFLDICHTNDKLPTFKINFKGFFVKFGGKFFSAHLANSVSAYIFL